MRRYLFVGALCLVALSVAHAQPPEVGKKVPAKVPAKPKLPLLKMPLENFVAAHGGLTYLTLQMKNATAAEIGAELEKQSGLKIEVEGNLASMAADKATRFSVEADNLPFWQAMFEWNRGPKELVFGSEFSASNRSFLYWGSYGLPGRSVAAGPCHLMLHSLGVTHQRQRNFSAHKSATKALDVMALYASLRFDPKFAPFIARHVVKIEKASDDKGRELITLDEVPKEVKTNHYPSESNYDASLAFGAPAEDAQKLNVQGTIRLVVVSKSQRWEVEPRKTPDAEKTIVDASGDVVLHWQKVTNPDQRVEFKLWLKRKGEETPPLPGWGATAKKEEVEFVQDAFALAEDSIDKTLHFFNKEGAELSFLTSRSTQSNRALGSRTLNFTFPRWRNEKDMEKFTPAKIVLDVPLEWREVSVPFELKDVPLP